MGHFVGHNFEKPRSLLKRKIFVIRAFIICLFLINIPFWFVYLLTVKYMYEYTEHICTYTIYMYIHIYRTHLYTLIHHPCLLVLPWFFFPVSVHKRAKWSWIEIFAITSMYLLFSGYFSQLRNEEESPALRKGSFFISTSTGMFKLRDCFLNLFWMSSPQVEEPGV